MNDELLNEAVWRKSSHSNGDANCVETCATRCQPAGPAPPGLLDLGKSRVANGISRSRRAGPHLCTDGIRPIGVVVVVSVRGLITDCSC